MENEKENQRIKLNIVDYIQVRGKIICETGLTIGTGDIFGIGGIDKEMIRTGRENLPYIPGSSLKGKMRHLFELMRDETPMNSDGTPHSCDNLKCPICRIFGAGKTGHNTPERGPTRLIVRDAYLDEKSSVAKNYKERTGKYTEIKPENVIDRLNGQAKPRHFERVPAGIEFNLELVYRQFKITNGDETYCDVTEAKEDIHYILDALSYIHRDYLGASGSRGYGKVKFELETDDETVKSWIEEKIGGCPGVYWKPETPEAG
jgi:CRISPR-associated protein Csm3